MSEKSNIDKVALDFITVYKRIKDKRRKTHRSVRGEGLVRNEAGKRGRLDKINS